ncbi:MAG: PD-(D/E)XK motif protein [Erysipelotrichaceae bacterium]
MGEFSIYNEVLKINKPESGYFVFKHEKSNNYFGKDENDNVVFLIKSESKDRITNFQETKSLVFIYNKECSFKINEKLDFERVHILICKSKDYNNIHTFIRLTEMFSIESKTSIDLDYMRFFKSLVFLFDKDKIISEIEAQGVFAELLVIKHFYNFQCDLLEFWQSKSKMKFDFMVDERKRIEVKSTVKNTRTHHFLHDQLLSNDYDIIVVSVMLQRSDSGLSILELTNDLKELFPNNYNFNLFIETYISKLSYEMLNNIRYDEIYFLRKLKIFKSENIPKIKNEIPQGIYNVEYDVVMDNLEEMIFYDFKKWLGDKDV